MTRGDPVLLAICLLGVYSQSARGGGGITQSGITRDHHSGSLWATYSAPNHLHPVSLHPVCLLPVCCSPAAPQLPFPESGGPGRSQLRLPRQLSRYTGAPWISAAVCGAILPALLHGTWRDEDLFPEKFEKKAA